MRPVNGKKPFLVADRQVSYKTRSDGYSSQRTLLRTADSRQLFIEGRRQLADLATIIEHLRQFDLLADLRDRSPRIWHGSRQFRPLDAQLLLVILFPKKRYMTTARSRWSIFGRFSYLTPTKNKSQWYPYRFANSATKIGLLDLQENQRRSSPKAGYLQGW